MWYLVALFFFATLVEIESKSSICFYANWAQYRKGDARFLPEHIDVNLCTHITYAHLQIDLVTHKLMQRQKNDHLLLARIVALKKLKPSLKVIVSVGGWSHDKYLPRFSSMVQSKTTRSSFINSAIAYMKTHQLDGISIDWEYPTQRGTSGPGDKDKYTLLLQEIRQAYVEQNLDYTLSASVSAGRRIIGKAYDILGVAKVVDWVNVMAYALRGAWQDVTGHHTAMTGKIPNVPDCLNAWIEKGMPQNKINLGLATYGRTFVLVSPDLSYLGAPVTGGGLPGKHTGGNGILSYYEYCEFMWEKNTPWYQSTAGAPYSSKGNEWIGYESPSSLKHKVLALVNPNCLHGVAIWALGYDDFSGKFCGQGKFPLVSAAVHAMDNRC